MPVFKLAHRPHSKEWPNNDNMRRPVQNHARSHFETASSAIHGIRCPLSKAHRLPPGAKCSGTALSPYRAFLFLFSGQVSNVLTQLYRRRNCLLDPQSRFFGCQRRKHATSVKKSFPKVQTERPSELPSPEHALQF